MAHAAEPLILLCNDDGFHREGIRILFRRLRPLGQTVIVAPDRERSASSLSLTLRRPLRLHRVKPGIWSVDGTPADCIYFALDKILPRRPDLLISGMNPGPNLGQLDAHYSGTVAAAFQGSFFDVPSIAVSTIPNALGRFFLNHAASVVYRLVERILAKGLPQGVTLNVNIPAPPVLGLRITRLGRKYYTREVIEKKDPRGQSYYWIGTGNPESDGASGTDIRATERNYVSITPLQTDLTCEAVLGRSPFQKLFKGISLD
ncbi:MAG: 5'/3'-nucleotidase SurE [Candidatus Aminicenantes bacterium]|nr:5'/3'-nucleotidase SurE [Candidatus Aminicenantes bacterium]